MKHLKLTISVFILCFFLNGMALVQNIHLQTSLSSLVLSAAKGEKLEYLYYGEKLSETDYTSFLNSKPIKHDAYPAYGLTCPTETALAVQHTDGNLSLDLVVIGTKERQEDAANITTIELKDKVYPFYVSVNFKLYPDAEVVETWTDIRHEEKKIVHLNQFSSGYLPIRRCNVWVSHLYGSWSNEGQLVQEPLEPGMLVVKNKDSVRNSHTAHPEVVFSLDGKPSENTGHVIGAALCYSGNYKLRVDTHDDEYHHFFAGINEENSAYQLKKGEVFSTPALALTFSAEGLSRNSRNFHRWARQHKNRNSKRKLKKNSHEEFYPIGFCSLMKSMADFMGKLQAGKKSSRLLTKEQ